MTRRLEAGPLLVALGAAVLIVSLFLDWFDGGLSAWRAFEVWDLVLTVLAVIAFTGELGLLTPDIAAVERRWLPPVAVAALLIVVSQLLDPPPAALGEDLGTGAWLALASTVALAVGTLLTFSRVQLAFSVEGREQRVRVPAVDARGEEAEPPPEPPAGAEPPTAATRGERLFGRRRGHDPAEPTDTARKEQD
jgi:hypothetical protein